MNSRRIRYEVYDQNRGRPTIHDSINSSDFETNIYEQNQELAIPPPKEMLSTTP